MKESTGPGILDNMPENAKNGGVIVKRKPAARAEQQEDTAQSDNEVMGDIVEQARHVQRVAEKIYFLSALKRFGLAFGGILLLMGAIGATAFFLLFFGVFTTGLPRNMEMLAEIGLALVALIHILAGLALLAG